MTKRDIKRELNSYAFDPNALKFITDNFIRPEYFIARAREELAKGQDIILAIQLLTYYNIIVKEQKVIGNEYE